MPHKKTTTVMEQRRWDSYTTAEEYSTISESQLQIWVAKGILPVSKVGRKVVIDRRELDRVLEGLKVTKQTNQVA